MGISYQLEASTCHDDIATCDGFVGSNECQSKVYVLSEKVMHYMFAEFTNAYMNYMFSTILGYKSKCVLIKSAHIYSDSSHCISLQKFMVTLTIRLSWLHICSLNIWH